MVKKFLIIAVFMCILFCSTAFAYIDTEGHWAEKEINTLSLNNIIDGYSDGTFKPNKEMTRAELVTLLNRLLNNQVQNTKYVPDINAKNWFYAEIRKGIESGIIQGDSDGYVRPYDMVTREEAILMIQRALVPVVSNTVVKDYEDSSEVSTWSKDAVNTFLSSGYISGYKDNTIKPKNNITRAEVVKVISNIIDVYATFGEYTGNVHGNVIVLGKNVSLKNVTIDGDLIVAEGAQGTLKLENIIIEGNLILRDNVEIPTKNFKVKGKTIDLKSETVQETSKYINDEYGISFSIPEKAVVEYISEDNKRINYNRKNLMTIRINQNDDLYFTSFETALFKEKNRFDMPYEELEIGKIGRHNYAVCGSKRDESYFFYLKRDNVEYSIYFFNIESINVIDSLVNSISLYDGTLINAHEIKEYNNPSLYLKFPYLDYVTVDDSYNTGNVNDEEGFFKMFIQVTNIIDMSDYTIDQLKDILVSLEDTDGEIINTEVKKVYTYDAIEYTVKTEDRTIKSLYVVISTKLYHFIFVGDEEQMEQVGVDIYNDIINSIEF